MRSGEDKDGAGNHDEAGHECRRERAGRQGARLGTRVGSINGSVGHAVAGSLGAKYRTVGDLRIGHEILPLYPDKAPARLGGRSRAS